MYELNLATSCPLCYSYPIRRLAVSLSSLSSDQEIQLSLFEQNRDRLLKIGYTMDKINNRYGKTTLMRATSFLSASQAKDRAAKIGGHYLVHGVIMKLVCV